MILILTFYALLAGGGACVEEEIEKEEGILSSFEELGLNWLAHVVDKKPILWAMGDSIPDLVPTWFLPVPSS